MKTCIPTGPTAAPLRALAFALACGLAAFATHAQDSTSSRPVRLVVPAPPGGMTDNIARGLGQALSALWKQPVIVDNRPGANTVIGADNVAKSAPDGLTLLVTPQDSFVTNPYLYKKLPYNAERDFTPISTVGRTTPVIVVPGSSPYRTLAEFIAAARIKPFEATYGSTGPGSFSHVATEQLSRLAGIKMTQVPYKGSAPLHLDLVAGHLGMYIGQPDTSMAQLVKDGKLRMLASATDHRLAQYPDLPTASEAGVPGFVITAWWGIAAPANLPPPVLAKLQGDIVKVIASPGFQASYVTGNNLEPLNASGAEFARLIGQDSVTWKNLIEASGAAME